jgi:hypothetical protein
MDIAVSEDEHLSRRGIGQGGYVGAPAVDLCKRGSTPIEPPGRVDGPTRASSLFPASAFGVKRFGRPDVQF